MNESSWIQKENIFVNFDGAVPLYGCGNDNNVESNVFIRFRISGITIKTGNG